MLSRGGVKVLLAEDSAGQTFSAKRADNGDEQAIILDASHGEKFEG